MPTRIVIDFCASLTLRHRTRTVVYMAPDTAARAAPIELAGKAIYLFTWICEQLHTPQSAPQSIVLSMGGAAVRAKA